MLSDTEQQEVVNYVMADVPRRLELAVGMYAAYDKALNTYSKR
jgi:hypothetical protein